MKILNSSGLNMDLWGTPLVTDLHPDIEQNKMKYEQWC